MNTNNHNRSKKYFLLELFLFFFIFIPCLFSSPARKYYLDGLRANDNSSKIKYFSVAYKLDPLYSEALIALATAYFDNHQILECEKKLDEYDQKFPPSADVLVLRGKILHVGRLFDHAEKKYQEALVITPSHSEALFRLGLLNVMRSNMNQDKNFLLKATEYFLKVNNKSNYYKFALTQAANCFEQLQKYQEAMKCYKDLSDIKDHNSMTIFNYGRLQYMNQNYEAASALLERASEMTFKEKTYDPFFSIFRFYITKIWIGDEVSGDYEFKKYMDIFPKSDLGDLFLKKISVDDFLSQTLSKKRLEKMSPIRIKVLKSKVYNYCGYYYLLENNEDEALKYFDLSFKDPLKGSHYYYFLSMYEAQRIRIDREIKAG